MTARALLLLLTAGVSLDAEVITLEDAIAIAETHTRDMIRARADVLLVDVERARALGAVLPQVNLRLPVGYQAHAEPIAEVRSTSTLEIIDADIDENFGEAFIRPSLSLRQLVFDGGRWWLTISRADDIEEQRKASLAAVRNNIRLNVVRNFYNVERTRQALATFRLQMETSEAQLEKAHELKKEAAIAQAERNLAADRVTLARREFSRAEAVRNLNIAIGRDASLPVQTVLAEEVRSSTTAMEIEPPPPIDRLLDLMREHRPELIGSRATLAIIDKNIGIRRAAYFPQVTVGATYRRGWNGFGSRRADRAFDLSYNHNVLFDATVAWNLFDGLRTTASVTDGEIALHKSRADYDDLLRRVEREVRSTRQRVELQRQVFELARLGLRAAEHAAQIARRDFADGKLTTLELRDAELKWTQAKQSTIDARLDVEIAVEELRRAVGVEL